MFVGGGTIEAAQQICNADGAVGDDVTDGIAALLNSSLLQHHMGYDGRSRFGMLETLREYALGQLVASGEAETLRQRMLRTTWRWPRPPSGRGTGEWDWLRRLGSVRDNLCAALRWTLDARDAAMALRLNGALLLFWTICSALSE